MSWDVKESWENQGVTTTTAADGKSGSSGLSRFFSLVAPGVGYTTVQALSAAGLPLMNDPHPQNSSLRVRNRDVSQDGPISFSATISYEAQINDPNDPSQNPLLRPAVIRFSAVTQEVEIDEDINGDPIETVNGEPIVGVTRPFTDLVVTVQRNLPTFNPLSISTYMNKINSATWYGLPAGTVRITDIQAGNVFSEDFEYWDVSISFQIRRGFGSVTDAKAWWHRTAHQGYIIDDGAGVRAIAKADAADDFTANGETVAQPVMLDLTTGERLAAGTGAYIEFQVLDEIDFNGLNLL
jgi:hypothetical protein